jgi:hypothetical protein
VKPSEIDWAPSTCGCRRRRERIIRGGSAAAIETVTAMGGPIEIRYGPKEIKVKFLYILTFKMAEPQVSNISSLPPL